MESFKGNHQSKLSVYLKLSIRIDRKRKFFFAEDLKELPTATFSPPGKEITENIPT